MIAGKIAQAKQAKQKILIKLVAIIFGAAVMAALLLYLVTNFKLVRDEASDRNEATQVQQPTVDIKPKETADSQQSDRQTYLDAYQYYQTSLKPSLNSIDLVRWDKSVFDEVQRLENVVLDTFSAGNYTEAVDTMNKLTVRAKDTITRNQNEYDSAIASAKTAYAALDYNAATSALKKASLHKNDSKALSSLSAQVENIPKIRDLEDKIRTASNENKAERELQAINAVASVDPNWGDYSQRKASLVSQLSSARFNQATSRAYAALDKKQVNVAKSELNKASAISSSRQEVKQLSAAISDLERTNRLSASVANADAAETSDDWDKAGVHIKQALNDKPSDQQLTARLEKAKNISELKKQMTSMLANPYRLAAESIKVRAKTAVLSAKPYTKDSASLNALSSKLANTVEAVSKNVAVELLSDGATSVSVRGIGIVGKTNTKVIQLKPGSYTFEGTRQGYKSKIVTVTIPIDKTSFQLTVVADEQI